ncbi:photosystem II D1 precursor processing protein PSB27-H2, chloroplastic isoform X1 [Olea europaea var. sylvestris]|uniref:photosystem II D1 precursor processing protein PSB27-H2, chloroplastic isoform X1 n=1 Tax=Olea europaea var. sylvestris TaxID=158386 RepID=UPI000C1D8D4D|nr:photosystem II D1 precursor processing protein PSB27-H2, chloroplastic isoform X1 [Olea europaea var. sylvestris]
MAYFLAMKMCPLAIYNSVGHISKFDRLQFRCHAMFSSEEASSRRQFVIGCSTIYSCAFLNLNCKLVELPAWAGEESNALDDNNDGVLGAMKSLFDPNEKTKSGKVLPKAYLKSAREVLKTLRESLKEDSKDIAKFRRTADAAKESIREYLNGWRGQKTVVNEESYVVLEKAIRSLASFYSKAGPSATLPEEIKSEILSDLNKAEELL